MLAITGPRKPKEDNLLDTVLGCHWTPKILWVALVSMPQETHSGGDYPGGPVVSDPPSGAGDRGLIPG